MLLFGNEFDVYSGRKSFVNHYLDVYQRNKKHRSDFPVIMPFLTVFLISSLMTGFVSIMKAEIPVFGSMILL